MKLEVLIIINETGFTAIHCFCSQVTETPAFFMLYVFRLIVGQAPKNLRLVRAGLHGCVWRRNCCFCEGVRNRTSRTSSLLLLFVSSAALQPQGRQLRPHREDRLFSSLQCVCVWVCVSLCMCVSVCVCARMPLARMICTVLIGASVRHREQKTNAQIGKEGGRKGGCICQADTFKLTFHNTDINRFEAETNWNHPKSTI